MSKRELKFTIGDKVLIFKVQEFDDLDLDKLLRIDYDNLVAELVTFPVVVNKLGLLAVDMDNELQESKLDLSIFEAKRKKELREELETSDEKGKMKKPTIDEVDSALLSDPKWKVKKKVFLKIQKEKEYMYTIYQSAKDKSNKLDKLSMTLRTGDIDDKIIQQQLNNVYFKIKDGRIKGEMD
jgi:phosphoenolpyruvate-protein kinase (PTS system EI component)